MTSERNYGRRKAGVTTDADDNVDADDDDDARM